MAGLILQLIMIAGGVIVLIVAVTSLARKRMSENFCMVWGIMAILLILAGILLRPVGWTRYLSWTGLVFLILLVGCGILFVYFLSTQLSELSSRVNDMASEIAILKEENERLKKASRDGENHDLQSVRG